MDFSEQQKRAVWNRATTVDGFDSRTYRKDACGAWIIWDKYGDRDNLYGWEIDHIVPRSLLEKNGFDELMINDNDNLRVLQCKNNISKGDDYPSYIASVTSDGNKNIIKERPLIVHSKKQERLKALYNL
ncbi:MAG: hypothetical protein ACI3Y2_05350 [Candidatus Egerieousia sp.]